MMNNEREVASDNVESEPAAQENDEIVDINQLDINKLTRSICQLPIDRNSDNLTQALGNTFSPCKNQFIELKMKSHSINIK